jgi:hypothetical protein
LIRSKIRNKYENTYKYRHLFQFKDSFCIRLSSSHTAGCRK